MLSTANRTTDLYVRAGRSYHETDLHLSGRSAVDTQELCNTRRDSFLTFLDSVLRDAVSLPPVTHPEKCEK